MDELEHQPIMLESRTQEFACPECHFINKFGIDLGTYEGNESPSTYFNKPPETCFNELCRAQFHWAVKGIYARLLWWDPSLSEVAKEVRRLGYEQRSLENG